MGGSTVKFRWLSKAGLLAAIFVSMGGWLWLLGHGIKWLVAKL
jgi:hypothetical protein